MISDLAAQAPVGGACPPYGPARAASLHIAKAATSQNAPMRSSATASTRAKIMKGTPKTSPTLSRAIPAARSTTPPTARPTGPSRPGRRERFTSPIIHRNLSRDDSTPPAGASPHPR